MSKSSVKGLQDRVADAQHDIDSIGTEIAHHDESPEQNQGLRGLQEMYRKRIVTLDAEIASDPSSKEDDTESSEEGGAPAEGPPKSTL